MHLLCRSIKRKRSKTVEDDNVVSRDETFSSDMCVYGFVSVDDCTYGCMHMVVKTSAPIFGEINAPDTRQSSGRSVGVYKASCGGNGDGGCTP